MKRMLFASLLAIAAGASCEVPPEPDQPDTTADTVTTSDTTVGDSSGQSDTLVSCVPSCQGKLCGDDGCGGSCGGCSDGQFCQFGRVRILWNDDKSS